MAVTAPPFAGVTNVTEVVSANAQTQILARIDLVIALVKRSSDADGNGTSMPSPEFDKIDPRTADALVVELEALKTAIDAAPTS